MTTGVRYTGLQQEGLVYERIREQRSGYLLYKRVFDLVICLLILPFVGMLILILAIMIVIDSPGSPFFIQERVGKSGRRFRMYKLRTMTNGYNDEKDRAFMQAYVKGLLNEYNNENDTYYKPISKKHITRLGRFLRKASLDELPQILNILKGEMSLIGPRPNITWEVESYLDWHLERLEVLPGITGLAQVNGRSNITFDQIASYDIQYVRNLSPQLDVWILWRTFWIALAGNGAG